jgi:hypothetical protein
MHGAYNVKNDAFSVKTTMSKII